MLPSETYFVTATVIMKIASKISAILQSIINTIPPAVATPLPPLKLKKQGKMCPMTQKRPAKDFVNILASTPSI